MCLAKAYLQSSGDESDAELLLENVTRVEVDGERVHLSSLLGERQEVDGRVARIDFSEGRLMLVGSRQAGDRADYHI